ncbi:MAG: hypothetical protein JF616_10180 [Fibrobacteres bacterium]|jgi:hypothetical protein|nr:hypothetical protein [Fibrobacterota bacterium]
MTRPITKTIFSAALAVSVLCLGHAAGQSQTNITVQGDGTESGAPGTVRTPGVAPDTVKHVVPPAGTGATPREPVIGGSSTVIKDSTYAPPDTSHEVGRIAPEDTKVLQNRREAKRFSTAGFGPAGFGNIDERTPAYDLYVGRLWEVNKFAAIKALGEVASDFDRATLGNVSMGANLYASPTDFSPYVGGGLGLAYGAIPGDRNFGFNVGAQIGALLFRTANAQMNLEGSAEMMVSQLGNSDPSIYSARLGVLF